MLSWYAPQLISNAEEKWYKFLSGLKVVIKQPLIPLGINDYSMLEERDRCSGYSGKVRHSENEERWQVKVGIDYSVWKIKLEEA